MGSVGSHRRSAMKTVGLSKSRILVHRQCAKRLWLQTYKPDLACESAGSQRVMASGNTVGETARTLWPQGRLINGQDLSQALRDTRMALAESPRQPLFEATFEHDGILVRADLLIPVATGYRVIEVKSSASVKDYHLPDAAVQSWVVRGAGLEASSVEIAHIDTAFIYGGAGDYRGLFKHQNITDATNSLLHAVPQWANEAR